MYWNNRVELSELQGKTIKDITGLDQGSDAVKITTECGKEYLFYHEQDCCESVNLEDFEVSADSLVGGLIVSAEEVTSHDDEDKKPYEYSESWTWTFYKIETNKGGLWMRWLGESNGYYGEGVDFSWINKPQV